MIKLLTIILCIISFSAFSQSVIPGSSPANTVEDGRKMFRYNMVAPTYSDTVEANLPINKGVDSAGAMIYTYADSSVWIRKHAPKRWSKIGQSSGAGVYDLTFPSNITVGGIPSGTNLTGLTWQQVIEKLTVAYLAPSFSSFIIAGQQQIIEVGDSVSGSKNFAWVFNNASNVLPNSMDIVDVTNSVNLASNISLTSPHSYNFSGVNKIVKTTQSSHSWRGSADEQNDPSGNNAFNSANFTVNWYWGRYAGFVNTGTPNNATIISLNTLTGISGTKAFLSTSKAIGLSTDKATAINPGSPLRLCIALPVSFGDIQIFDTNSFNITTNFDKTTVTITNAFGISNSYNLWIVKAGSETSGDFTFYTM